MKKILSLSLLLLISIFSCTNPDKNKSNIKSESEMGHIELSDAEFDSLALLINQVSADSSKVFQGIYFGNSKELVEKKLRHLFLEGVLSLDQYDNYSYTFINKDGSSMIGTIHPYYFEDKLFIFTWDFEVDSGNSKVVWRNAIQFIEDSYKDYYYLIKASEDNWSYFFMEGETNLRGCVLDWGYSVNMSIYDWEKYIKELKNKTNNKQ